MSVVSRLRRWAPVRAIHQELVRFDTQKMQNPEISGICYQQGTLSGYEVREYLLEKWGRKCAYCGNSGAPLQVEHILAKSRGGTNRVSNLTLACRRCNEAKASRPVEEFLAGKPGRLETRRYLHRRRLHSRMLLRSTRPAGHSGRSWSRLECRPLPDRVGVRSGTAAGS